MAGPRPEKVAVVEEVREHLANSDAAILTEYRGLKVGDLAVLRRQLRTAGADYKIFKNTLVRRATAGTDRASLDPSCKGPRPSPSSGTTSARSRRCSETSVGPIPSSSLRAASSGPKWWTPKVPERLADLPSRDVLLAQLAGAIAAPMRQFAGLLQALPRSFAYGLSALLEKRGGPRCCRAAEPEVCRARRTGRGRGAASRSRMPFPSREASSSRRRDREPSGGEPRRRPRTAARAASRATPSRPSESRARDLRDGARGGRGSRRRRAHRGLAGPRRPAFGDYQHDRQPFVKEEETWQPRKRSSTASRA